MSNGRIADRMDRTARNINRIQNHRYRFEVTGLLPNTKHTLVVDGVDYSQAARQIGKNFGEDLISDENGRLELFVLYEIPFNREQNFELPQTPTLAFQEEIVSRTNRREFNQVDNFVTFEIKSATENSYAQYIMRMPILLTAGGLPTLFPIE